MDSLRAFISDKDIFMHMAGQQPKIASIEKNSQVVDIMRKQPTITREEFEGTIPSNTAEECLYKGFYLNTIKLEVLTG